MSALPGAGLVSFGPLRMTGESRTIFVVGLAAACTLVALLAGLVFVLSRRLAAVHRKG
jgi:hypothetical protein